MTGPTNLVQGRIEWGSNSGTPTVNVAGGELIQTGGTITVVNLYGGRFTLKQGTATTINIYGSSAVLDLSQLVADVAITDINLYRGAWLRPAAIQLLSSTVNINYRSPGEHGQDWGTIQVLGS